MTDEIRTADLYDSVNEIIRPLFEESVYPWEILPKIGGFLKKLLQDGVKGYHLYAEGVLVGEGVSISPTATVIGPAIIGCGTEIRPGAYLRGNVFVGERCVVGNSSELKNCVLLDRAQVPHYNYVGDSVLGVGAHMGAGSICSNLKADGKAVVIHGKADHETALRKVGAFLGDRADIGCGCVLNPGTVVGKGTSIYPLTPLRGVYPAASIVKSATCTVPRRP